MIKLYGVRTSPYVRHARVALADSGLSWQFEHVTPDTITLSPTLRVPFLVDGDLTLTDSAVIVRYAREQSGQTFLPSVGDHELFALATSVLDTAVNLYLLNIGDSAALAEVATGTSAIGFNPRTYYERQQERIVTGMKGLDQFELNASEPFSDGHIRLACLLDWAGYRETIDLSGLSNLSALLTRIREWPTFAETAPDR